VPDGQISKNLSSPLCKNISVFPKYKSGYIKAIPSHRRGALRNVTSAGRDAVDAEARETGDANADGEVVWS
jgi:hypothetical protein